jgi:endonuclease/exonuclease/phosphatase family metal-dependent hydrolase
MIKVATYNILAQHLSHTTKVHKDHLVYETRLPLIIDEITSMMGLSYIIALQEMTLETLDRIKPYFALYNYKYIYTLYGANDLYGVAMLIPEEYSIIFARPFHIGSIISNKPTANYKKAKNYKHKAILVRLSLDDKEFEVCTYHMPCAFMTPHIIAIHMETLMSLFDTKLPSILLGDFNLRPNTRLYNFVVQGKYNELKINPFIDTRPLVYRSMPTVKTIASDGKEFCDILDYIFTSKDFVVRDFVQEKLESIIPNESHGSDHIPIRCVLSLY